MTSNALSQALDRFRAAISRGRGGGATSGAGATAYPLGMIRFTFTDDSAENAKGIDRIFDAFGNTIDDLPDVLLDPRFIEVVRAAFARNFDSQGATGRGAWAPLAPRTLAERQRLGYGPGPILTRTGALRAHVLAAPPKVYAGGGSVQLRIEPDVMVNGVPKYRALALGLATRNLPGRPMVTVGPASAARITSSLQRALRARALANGLG